MKTLYHTCLLLLLFSACHTPGKSLLSSYCNTGKLPVQLFIINPDIDTTVVTVGGIRIHITRGSFEGGKPVTVEWKEALDFQSMLKAGLLTKSGKNILRSGGMFYFNTQEKLTIQKPISIDVPAETIVSGMQLYKGDSAAGKLDWQDPKPIENIKAYGENILGKALFDGNCAQCHGIGEAHTAPALAGFRNRGPWDDRQKLYAWTHNPAAFMATDKYILNLKCKYGVMMQAFPELSNAALDSLYRYVDEEAERLGIVGDPGMTGSDSCADMQRMYDSLLTVRTELHETNNSTIDVDYHFDSGPAHYIEDFYKAKKPKLITALENRSDYYHITIDVAGWQNVDGLLEEWSGSVPSRLIVQMQGGQADKQEVYLAIPALKVFVQGGYLDNGKDIGFLETNGNIKLPQHVQAIVFAVGEQQGKFYFSKKDFITLKDQTVTLSAHEFSRDGFDKQMAQMEKFGLTTRADTTTHFSSLKSMDEGLDKLKNELMNNCGCWPGDNISPEQTAAPSKIVYE